IVNSADNVAVVKRPIAAGTVLEMPDGKTISVTGDVASGNRFATKSIRAGDLVLQYAEPIGTSLGIGEGDPVSHANMSDEVPVRRDRPDDLRNAEPFYIPPDEAATFTGFRRSDGRVGTRNYVLIIPTSMCSSHEAQQIATIAEFTMYKRERYPNVDGI